MQTSNGLRGLDRKTAIVTGAASGIGRAIATRLCEEGCSVGIFDRNAAAGAKLASELSARGGDASAYAVDITGQTISVSGGLTMSG
jgi:2-hydroxycyclohexanecarboxyl-CoA dehydrogenase